jgi:glycosyltransferase involved in cell wall biosynthesis
VVTPAFKDYLIDRWRVPAEKIDVVENGVETDLFAPADPAVAAGRRKELNAESRFLVCYIGTMGMAHGLETLVEAAARLQSEDPNALFLLIGEGSEKERIKSVAQARGLTNVQFLDQQPRENIPSFISASDVCLVLLKKTDVFKTVIPTKMLEFMSCARPVILGVEGLARQILEDAAAGLAIEPENADALASAITQLDNNRDLAKALGEPGRAYILEKFSRANTAQTYLTVLRDVVSTSR